MKWQPRDSSSGSIQVSEAFVAAPLSYAPHLELATLNAAGRAAMAVARLDQAVSQLPNQDLLIRPVIRREATSTSALEGTYAEFDAVLEADFLAEPELTTEQREIGNVVRATEHAVRELTSRPIGRRLIGELQAMIVRGTGGDTYDSGDLRQRQVFIGPGGRPVEEARFVPCTPGDRLAEGFSDWEKWVNTAADVPIVVRLAMAHYQFETLHPYADGNGRLGRLILTLQLIDDGALRWPLLNISSWLEEHRTEYMNHLLEISCTGALDSWIKFFARGIQESSDTALETISQLLDFRDRLLPALRRKGVRGTGLVIAENLLGYPVIDVRTAAALAGVTFQAANTGVARLVGLGILAELTGRPTNRLFLSRETLNSSIAEVRRPRSDCSNALRRADCITCEGALESAHPTTK